VDAAGDRPALLSLVSAELNEARKGRGHATIDGALLADTGDTIINDFYARVVADLQTPDLPVDGK